MFDVNRHKLFLFQILKDIYNDIELVNYLGFKGGSALAREQTHCRIPYEYEISGLPGKVYRTS
jgi:hypothetical protein